MVDWCVDEIVRSISCFSPVCPIFYSCSWINKPSFVVKYLGCFQANLHFHFSQVLSLRKSFCVNVEVNSSGEFIYTQIVNENVNQTQTPDNYVENPRREKSRRREFPLNQIDYKFSIFYYTFYLQGPLSCKGGRDRLYSWGLMSWVVASEIFASGSTHYRNGM